MLRSNWHARVGEQAVPLSEIMKNNDKAALIKWLDRQYNSSTRKKEEDKEEDRDNF